MKLDIGLLHQLDPELLRIRATAIKARSHILLFFVRQQGIDHNLLPLSVFEELEGHESLIEVIFLNNELVD